MLSIREVKGREIIDSRGNPTVEAEVTLACGIKALGSAPSGASTGEFEAIELRDGDKNRYLGKGVKNAVKNIDKHISKAILGMNASDTYALDRAMIELDGTENKQNMGANAILAVSIATAKAASIALDMPLYRFIGGVSAVTLPVPMMNILNGGAHATNNVDIQEFMIMPVGADSFAEALRNCCEVFHALKSRLAKKGLATAVGDEGGFAPNLESDEAAIKFILEAISDAGFNPGKDFYLALDAASSEWKSGKKGEYIMPKSGARYSSDDLIDFWEGLCDKYPIISIEDGLDEEDWDGFESFTSRLGSRLQIVGDDLFVTNTKRLKKGVKNNVGNSILIKPNQIGSISESIDAVKLAKKNHYTSILSHRSGETEDVTIAHLAVALNAGQIKTGAPCRGERVAKYNELLRIEESLGASACYLGKKAFNVKRD